MYHVTIKFKLDYMWNDSNIRLKKSIFFHDVTENEVLT